MGGNRFPIVLVVAALVLVLVAGSAGALALHNGMVNAPVAGDTRLAQQAPDKQSHQVPPELQGLNNLPPTERFAHFVGAQVKLKDKNNNPLTINVTPGTVMAVSLSSLTIAANDGTTKTYGLSDSTAIRGKPAQGATQPTLANGDLVVVVTFNNETIPRAVVNGGKDGSGFEHGGGAHHGGSGY